MLEIQKAIKKIIERFIVIIRRITNNASVGDTTIYIQGTRRFRPGDHIVIRSLTRMVNHENDDVAIYCISRVVDRHTLILTEPLVRNCTASDSVVQKVIGYEDGDQSLGPHNFLRAIYLGDPAVIPMYPAITIDAKSKNSEWFTLESLSQEYQIDITMYVDGHASHEAQYTLMHLYIKQIEDALLRTLYPLVQPYRSTTLTEDVNPTDDIIRVTDENFFQCGMGWIFLENIDYLVPNRAIKHLGSGSLQLVRPAGASFSAGDTIIHPLRHIYDSLAYSTAFGIVNKGTVLKAGKLSFRCKEERRVFTPNIDPLTF